MRVTLWNSTAFFCLALTAGGCASSRNAGPEITPVERIVGAQSQDQADLLFDQGAYPQAAAAYRRILNDTPDNIEARYGLAEALRMGGDPTAARAEYLAVSQDPAWRGRALEGLGHANLMNGDHNGAFEALSAAVAEDDKAWRAWLGLAQLRDLARDWEHSDEYYAAALAATDQPAIVYNNQGVSTLARGDPEKARSLFQKALGADPNFERARTNLELAEAARNISVESVAAAEPDARKRAQKLNNYGYVAMLQGRLAEAERYFQAAIDAHPSFYATAYENLKVLKGIQAAQPVN